MYLFMPGEPVADVVRRIIGPTARTLFVAILVVALIGIEVLFWETSRWFGVVLGNLFLPVSATIAPLYEGVQSGTSGLLTCYATLLALIPLLRIDGRGGLPTPNSP